MHILLFLFAVTAAVGMRVAADSSDPRKKSYTCSEMYSMEKIYRRNDTLFTRFLGVRDENGIKEIKGFPSRDDIAALRFLKTCFPHEMYPSFLTGLAISIIGLSMVHLRNIESFVIAVISVGVFIMGCSLIWHFFGFVFALFFRELFPFAAYFA